MLRVKTSQIINNFGYDCGATVCLKIENDIRVGINIM